MAVPCPACRTPLEVDSAPRAHGIALCPVPECRARLVLTADHVPFDPVRHSFRLKTWEQAKAEADQLEHVSWAETVTARIGPSVVCGLLTGVVVALAASRIDSAIPMWLPFTVGTAISTIIFTAVLGLMYVRDRRQLAKTMRFLVERVERAGTVILLRTASVKKAKEEEEGPQENGKTGPDEESEAPGTPS